MNDKLVDWAIQKCVEVVILRAENVRLRVALEGAQAARDHESAMSIIDSALSRRR